jgi:hypothetical protein
VLGTTHHVHNFNRFSQHDDVLGNDAHSTLNLHELRYNGVLKTFVLNLSSSTCKEHIMYEVAISGAPKNAQKAQTVRTLLHERSCGTDLPLTWNSRA